MQPCDGASDNGRMNGVCAHQQFFLQQQPMQQLVQSLSCQVWLQLFQGFANLNQIQVDEAAQSALLGAIENCKAAMQRCIRPAAQQQRPQVLRYGRIICNLYLINSHCHA